MTPTPSTSTRPWTPVPLRRFRVYRSRASAEWLCVALARDKRHAVAVARQQFCLGRDAYAVADPVSEPVNAG